METCNATTDKQNECCLVPPHAVHLDAATNEEW